MISVLSLVSFILYPHTLSSNVITDFWLLSFSEHLHKVGRTTVIDHYQYCILDTDGLNSIYCIYIVLYCIVSFFWIQFEFKYENCSFSCPRDMKIVYRIALERGAIVDIGILP